MMHRQPYVEKHSKVTRTQ